MCYTEPMIIYIDILFITNLMMDSLLLGATSVLAGRRLRGWRLAVSASAGSAVGCILFFVTVPSWLMLLLKFLIPAGMVLLAFSWESSVMYAKTVVVHLCCNLLFGGGMFAFYSFTVAGSRMLTANGVYYMELPLWLLLLFSFGSYGACRLFFHWMDGRREKRFIHTLTVDGRDLPALLDSGNSLYDPLSLTAVGLCQWDSVELPEEVLRAALHRDPSALPRLNQSYPALKLRLIPYRDAAGGETLIYAYRPQSLRVDGVEQRGLIGITLQPLSADGRFKALLHRDWSSP